MTCGIYCIQNTINQKKYIGLSTNIEQRLKDHLISLRNKNIKRENEHFIRSFHKYGEDAFQARIIIVCDQNILAPIEQYLIKIFKTYNPKFGYNKTFGGEKNQPTIETRKKISQNHANVKGKSNPFFGKKHSEETRKKMKQNHADIRGKNNPNYGRRFSEEHRKKISESKKGKYIGENNPNYNHNIPNGLKLLEERKQGIKVMDLATKYNCSRRTIRNRINKVL